MKRQSYLKGLTLPYAMTDKGRLLAANDVFKLESPPEMLTCPLCKAGVAWRHTENRRPHFSHNPGQGTDHSEEDINHDITVLVIEQVIKDHMGMDQEFPFYLKCQRCGKYHKKNILADRVTRIDRYTNFGTVSPDLMFYGQGTPLLALDVVVTTPISIRDLNFYSSKGLPVIEYTGNACTKFNAIYVQKHSPVYLERADWAQYGHYTDERSRLIGNYNFFCEAERDAIKAGLNCLSGEDIRIATENSYGDFSATWVSTDTSLDVIEISGTKFWLNLVDLSKNTDIKRRIRNENGFSWFFICWRRPLIVNFDFKSKTLSCKYYSSLAKSGRR